MKAKKLQNKINKLQKQLDNAVMEDEEKAEKLFNRIEKLRKELFFHTQTKDTRNG